MCKLSNPSGLDGQFVQRFSKALSFRHSDVLKQLGSRPVVFRAFVGRIVCGSSDFWPARTPPLLRMRAAGVPSRHWSCTACNSMRGKLTDMHHHSFPEGRGLVETCATNDKLVHVVWESFSFPHMKFQESELYREEPKSGHERRPIDRIKPQSTTSYKLLIEVHSRYRSEL